MTSLLLLSSVVGTATAYPSPPPAPYVARSPILIDDPSDITAANGVVSGTGTLADPFVITGWHIQVTTGAAITIRAVGYSFAIRHNLIESTGATTTGVSIEKKTATDVLLNNVFKNTGVAVKVLQADPIVDSNTMQGPGASSTSAKGVHLTASNAVVRENVLTGQHVCFEADRGAPRILDNDCSQAGDGVLLKNNAAGTYVGTNKLAAITRTGIRGETITDATLFGNTVTRADKGTHILSSARVLVEANTLHASPTIGLLVESSSEITVRANVVSEGSIDGARFVKSKVRAEANVIANHPGVGLQYVDSTGNARSNFVHHNGGGIGIAGTSVVTLTSNNLQDNAWGFSIPYANRQNIPLMSGNHVNGVNVDGTLVPAEKVYYYKDANVVVSGSVRDSGFSSGWYGSLTADGGLVLYEVDTARVEASYFAHHYVGVHAVNSFNVQVRSSTFVNNRIGVLFENVTVNYPVPDCVGFVKNSDIRLDVDPHNTIGVKATGKCFIGVFNSTIQTVATGITFDAKVEGEIAVNTILGAHVGIHVQGSATQKPDEMVIHLNTLVRNRIGMRLEGSGAGVYENSIQVSSRVGVSLEAGAHPRLYRNNVSYNLHGVLDASACGKPGSCSTVDARGNVFVDNRGHGLVVNNSATLRGDVFLGTGETSFILRGVVEAQDVVSIGGRRDGGVLNGSFILRNGTFRANANNGVVLVGEGHIRASNFTHNAKAGIYLRTIAVTALHVNASFNLDGIAITEELPPVNLPTVVLPSVSLSPLVPPLRPPLDRNPLSGLLRPDPLFIHRSILMENERNAIRTGPAAIVNASYNYWGDADGPRYDFEVTGTWGNSIRSVVVLAYPYYRDPQFTETGPIPGL